MASSATHRLLGRKPREFEVVEEIPLDANGG
jgi:hypothetical protein